MERPDLAERFATLDARKGAEAVLGGEIARWTAGQDKHDLARRLQAAGIAAAPVNTPADLVHWDYLGERGFFTELDHPEAGRHPYIGLPFHAENSRGGARTAAPCFGADNLYLLRDVLKMSEDEIEAALASGAFADRPNPGV
jgi:crotonobetainyl-CoA:carnitine CoA-transferase CaiB-like acyl-CoA transferase